VPVSDIIIGLTLTTTDLALSSVCSHH